VTAKKKAFKVTSIGGQMSIDTDLDQREYWLAYLRQRSLQVLADRFL